MVVVAELDGGENEALDLVPLVTNVVLEVNRSSILSVYENERLGADRAFAILRTRTLSLPRCSYLWVK